MTSAHATSRTTASARAGSRFESRGTVPVTAHPSHDAVPPVTFSVPSRALDDSDDPTAASIMSSLMHRQNNHDPSPTDDARRDTFTWKDVCRCLNQNIGSAPPVCVGSLVAYEFLDRASTWHWSIGEVLALTEHTAQLREWRCEDGTNVSILDALQREEAKLKREVCDHQAHIIALRAELGALRTQTELEMERTRSELKRVHTRIAAMDTQSLHSALLSSASTSPPPLSVQRLCDALLSMLYAESYETQRSWAEIRRDMAQSAELLLEAMCDYDVATTMQAKRYNYLKQHYLHDTALGTASAQRAADALRSPAASAVFLALLDWFQTQMSCFQTLQSCVYTHKHSEQTQRKLTFHVNKLKQIAAGLHQLREQLFYYRSPPSRFAANNGGATEEDCGHGIASRRPRGQATPRFSGVGRTFTPAKDIMQSTVLRSSIVMLLLRRRASGTGPDDNANVAGEDGEEEGGRTHDGACRAHGRRVCADTMPCTNPDSDAATASSRISSVHGRRDATGSRVLRQDKSTDELPALKDAEFIILSSAQQEEIRARARLHPVQLYAALEELLRTFARGSAPASGNQAQHGADAQEPPRQRNECCSSTGESNQGGRYQDHDTAGIPSGGYCANRRTASHTVDGETCHGADGGATSATASQPHLVSFAVRSHVSPVRDSMHTLTSLDPDSSVDVHSASEEMSSDVHELRQLLMHARESVRRLKRRCDAQRAAVSETQVLNEALSAECQDASVALTRLRAQMAPNAPSSRASTAGNVDLPQHRPGSSVGAATRSNSRRSASLPRSRSGAERSPSVHQAEMSGQAEEQAAEGDGATDRIDDESTTSPSLRSTSVSSSVLQGNGAREPFVVYSANGAAGGSNRGSSCRAVIPAAQERRDGRTRSSGSPSHTSSPHNSDRHTIRSDANTAQETTNQASIAALNEQVHTLDDLLQTAQSAKTQLEQRCGHAERELVCLRDNLTDAHNENIELRAQAHELTRLEAALSRAQQSNVSLQSQLERTAEDLHSATHARDTLQRRLDSVAAKCEVHAGALQSMREQLAALEADNSSLRTRVSAGESAAQQCVYEEQKEHTQQEKQRNACEAEAQRCLHEAKVQGAESQASRIRAEHTAAELRRELAEARQRLRLLETALRPVRVYAKTVMGNSSGLHAWQNEGGGGGSSCGWDGAALPRSEAAALQLSSSPTSVSCGGQELIWVHALRVEEENERLWLYRGMLDGYAVLQRAERDVMVQFLSGEVESVLAKLQYSSQESTDTLLKLEECVRLLRQARLDESDMRERLIQQEAKALMLQSRLDSYPTRNVVPSSSAAAVAAATDTEEHLRVLRGQLESERRAHRDALAAMRQEMARAGLGDGERAQSSSHEQWHSRRGQMNSRSGVSRSASDCRSGQEEEEEMGTRYLSDDVISSPAESVTDECDEVDSRFVHTDGHEDKEDDDRDSRAQTDRVSSSHARTGSRAPAGAGIAMANDSLATALQQALSDVALLREHLERVKREKEALECELAANLSWREDLH